MLYYFELTDYPRIVNTYTVTRNTIWEISEPEHLLIYIEKGSCNFSISNESKVVHEGDIIYIPANHSYIRSSINNTFCVLRYIHFTIPNTVQHDTANNLALYISKQKSKLNNDFLNADLQAISRQAHVIYLQYYFSNLDTKQFTYYLDNINSLFSKRLLMSNLSLSLNLLNLLVLLSQNTVDSIANDIALYDLPEINPKLKSAINYITMHYTEPITLEDLSNHCNISKQQLIRYFKKALNTTPTKYITDFKLARAKELLFYHQEISIKEIADKLGFDNQHYFSRVFSKKNGESPSHYRERTINYVPPEKQS